MSDNETFKREPRDLNLVFEQARRNRDLLDACPRHQFGPDIPGIEQGVGAMFGAKLKCTKCGGEMRLEAVNYYVRGYEASGKSGNDILPGWRTEESGNGRSYFKGEDT